MTAILASLGVAIAGFLSFVAWDAKAAFDDDPNTKTISYYFKQVRVVGALLTGAAAAATVYVFLHLWLQVV